MKERFKNGTEGECFMYTYGNSGKIHQQSNFWSYNGKDNLGIMSGKKKLSEMVNENGIEVNQSEMGKLIWDHLLMEDLIQELR